MTMDYQEEYLRSPLWRKIKRRILKRDGKICFHCGGPAVLAHHRSYERDVLEGNADHMLVSLCEGCHHFVHFDNEGRWRSLDETDQVLLAKNPPVSFPEPHVDLRLGARMHLPPNWSKMTAVQRQGWRARAHELVIAKRAALKARKEAALIRRQSYSKKPPREGLISLIDAIELLKKEPGTPSNAYTWYRDSAKSDGRVHIGQSYITAEKLDRQWYLLEKDFQAAIANLRQHEARLDQITEDYKRGLYHGEDGERVNTRTGYYILQRPFRFVFSDYAYYRRKSNGGWFCNSCGRAADLAEDNTGRKELACTPCGHRRVLHTL